MQKTKFTTAIGLDIGDKRIGVARINSVALIPEPLVTLANNEDFLNELNKVLSTERADLVVIGLPRNMSGLETAQTETVKSFVDLKLRPTIPIPIIFQDETLSSLAAESYPEAVIKDKGLDAIAAAEILRYFAEGNK